MPIRPMTLLAVLVSVASAAACSKEPASKSAASAPASKAPVIDACTLLTPEEANVVLHYKVPAARPQPDSLAKLAAARGESRCVFAGAKGQPIGEVVTVYDENGMHPMDQAALNDYATTLGIGDTAKTFTGLGVIAASMKDMPTIVAQKGDYVLLVSAPTMEGTQALAAKALARLP